MGSYYRRRKGGGEENTYTWEEGSLDDTEEEADGDEALVICDAASSSRHAGPYESHATEIEAGTQVTDNHVGGDLAEDVSIFLVSVDAEHSDETLIRKKESKETEAKRQRQKAARTRD